MELPARIGKYELQELLGGGMSRVYRARDTLIGRTVVVKILTEQACKDPEAKARFLQEARMAGNISHDNIIRVYDFGEEEGRPFMVMEFLRGEDLRSLIKTNRTGDLNCKLSIALQIARALEYIHTQKIIHRDIKPENIQVTGSGIVKLMDFGIAKAENTALTRPGFTLGTPFYMAPEQIRGAPATPAVDIYAFGILLYELVIGTRPIQADSIEKVFFQILHEPLDLSALQAAGNPLLYDLVVACTAKEPAQRPVSFSAVCVELERILRRLHRGPLDSTASLQALVPPSATGIAPGAPTPTPGRMAAVPGTAPQPVAKPAAKVNFWIAGLVVLVLLGAAAGAFFYFTRGGGPSYPPTLSTASGEMVLVPAGPFLAGKDKKTVLLPAFYIDRTEVSNATYERFCNDKGRPLPELFQKDHPDYPVVNITYVEAQEFAKWAGKRLPTPNEWEKAARGTDGRPYPWGSQRDPRRANVLDNPDRKSPDLAPVDGFLDSASPNKAVNMVGNVWEYVDDLRTPNADTLRFFARLLNPPPTASEPWYMIRGGAYDAKLGDGLWEYGTVPARYRAFNIGFRCVKEPK